MKKTIYSLLAITALLFSSCESFTELEPKGKNLLPQHQKADCR
jgi:starch-binding outer membrane protein, SusD/RagB family